MATLVTAPVICSTVSPFLKTTKVGMAFVNDRTHRAAGAAPGSPEVKQNRQIGFQNKALESGISDLFSHMITPWVA